MIAISKRMQWIRMLEVDQNDMFEHVEIEVIVDGIPGIIRGYRMDVQSFMHFGPLVLTGEQTENSALIANRFDDQRMQLTHRERNKIRSLVQKYRIEYNDEEDQVLGYYRSDHDGDYEWISPETLFILLSDHYQPQIVSRVQRSIRKGTPHRIGDSLILSVEAYQLMQRRENVGICDTNI